MIDYNYMKWMKEMLSCIKSQLVKYTHFFSILFLLQAGWESMDLKSEDVVMVGDDIISDVGGAQVNHKCSS